MSRGSALARLRRGRRPVVLGRLGSTRPVSSAWGWDRGTPIDRFYIERFLARHRTDVTGRVLEVKESLYTDRFGTDVRERAVLDVDSANGAATHVADLADGEGLPEAAFDCFLLTQTLQYVSDPPAAIATAHRVLRPGGVLLVTAPVTSRMTDPPATDLWRVTPPGLRKLLEEAFGTGAAEVEGPGNVLAQVAFLEGLAVEDLREGDLLEADERFPLVACGRAVRGA